MITRTLNLNEVEKVQRFVANTARHDFDIDLVSGRYIIDAKSIMGVFSLDLSKPIDVRINAEETQAKDFLDFIKEFEV